MIVSEALTDWLNGSPEPDLDGGYTMFRNDKLRLVIEQATDMERRSIRLENQMATLARRFSLALQRVSRGLPGKPVEFRCSHCGKTTPILLEMTFAAMAGERDETSDQAG